MGLSDTQWDATHPKVSKLNFMPTYDQREVLAYNQPSYLPTPTRIPPMPKFQAAVTLAHQFVVAVAHVDADIIEQFVVYQESKIEAALDIIHEHLGDEIHGKVFKMKSLADVKRTLALIGYLINVIEVI
jgi:hypothetical protein